MSLAAGAGVLCWAGKLRWAGELKDRPRSPNPPAVPAASPLEHRPDLREPPYIDSGQGKVDEQGPALIWGWRSRGTTEIWNGGRRRSRCVTSIRRGGAGAGADSSRGQRRSMAGVDSVTGRGEGRRGWAQGRRRRGR